MQYAKPLLTIDQQAELLLARGLIADRHEIVVRLRSVSYYRLSGYWYPFLTPDERFRGGTTLAAIWTRYTLDRHLRLLVIDAIERVEICLRAELVTHLAGEQGPFGYQDPLGLPNLTPTEHARLLAQLGVEYDRSRNRPVERIPRSSGSEHPLPPYWMLVELMSLGTLLTLFRGSPATVKKAIAARFGIVDSVLESWIKTLNVVRNICAHHGRLWNRELGVRPQIPRRDARWHQPVEVENTRIFGVLTVLRYLISDIAPQSGWSDRLQALHDEYPTVPRRLMGYPDDWKTCPIWVDSPQYEGGCGRLR